MHTPSPTLPLLECRGLMFARNQEPIFGPLNFQLNSGQALQVLGDNGSGKTTLLRVLAGLLPASTGELHVEGLAVAQPRLLGVCCFLGHLPGHKADLTALENLRFTAAMNATAVSPEQALFEVGLAGHEDRLARKLSAGQNKRLALARLCLTQARLWLLDEPYANLDLDGIALVNRLIAAHLAADGAVLMTTHGAYAAPPVPIQTLELSA